MNKLFILGKVQGKANMKITIKQWQMTVVQTLSSCLEDVVNICHRTTVHQILIVSSGTHLVCLNIMVRENHLMKIYHGRIVNDVHYKTSTVHPQMVILLDKTMQW